MSEQKIVVVAGARTPVGSFGGALKDVPAHELGARAASEALRRAGITGGDIEEVVMGCIGQVGPDAYNARRVAVAAGVPVGVPAFTVNRLCGSGLQAIWSAAMEMRWNGLDLALAGGDESMSRMPFYDFDARRGFRLGDRALVDGTALMLTDPFHQVLMGVTAERVAEKYGVSRREQDEFALESQRKASADAARAAFADEVVPVAVPGRGARVVSSDEHPKPETTVEILAGLRPAFDPNGTVTAGNSSASTTAAPRSCSPVSRPPATAGCPPWRPSRPRDRRHGARADGLRAGTGCSASSSRPARRRRRRHDRVNEAFAVPIRGRHPRRGSRPRAGQPIRRSHRAGPPSGATGAILTLRMVMDMVRRDLEFGVVTMCIGGGQALAALFRRV